MINNKDLEPVMQPFDPDLATHYEKLIDEDALPIIETGSEGTVYSTGDHAIKVLHDPNRTEEIIQRAYRNEKILEIAGISVPGARHIGNSIKGPTLIMNRMPKTTPYNKLTPREKENFDRNFNKALITAEEHGLTPADLNKYTNCNWNRKRQKVTFYDNEHWNMARTN